MAIVRGDVEEVVTALSAKVRAEVMADRPEGAERYASALRDAASALESVVTAEREE